MIAIGIDIGGTFVKFFAVNSKGDILKTEKIKTYTGLGGKEFLGQLAGVVNEWKKSFKKEKFIIGVGVAGDTDSVNGVLRFAPNMPWRNLKIAEGLKELTGCPCYVSNDANVAAWGVYKKEFNGKYKNMLVITLGTGVGGGLILGGKLYEGATCSAGEFGHIKVDTSTKAPKCGCGARGCLESYIGTKGIKRQAQKVAIKNPESLLAKLMNQENFCVELVSRAADKGDKVALDMWEKFGVWLGLGASALVLILNPDVLVLSGGVSRAGKYFLPSMQKVFDAQTIKAPFNKVKVLLSKEKDIGGIGAALFAFDRVNEK